MRDIKFRGKMIPENEWIYGTLLRIPAPPYCWGENPPKDKYYIQFADPRYMSDWGMPYKMVQGEVNPETVGQYTGLKDKNGAEIYEGDIVYIASEDKNAFVLWDKKTARYIIQFRGWCADFDNFYGKDLEVIRNIYDNKNLLEEVGEEL